MAANFPYARRQFILIQPSLQGFETTVWAAPWGVWRKVGDMLTVDDVNEATRRAALQQELESGLICFAPRPGVRK